MIRKLSIILSLFLFITVFPACGTDRTDTPAAATSDEEISSAILRESEDMGKNYIDSFVFFGESTTYHLKNREVLSGGKNTTQVLGNKSGTAMLDERTSDMYVILPESGALVTVSEALRRKKPKYLMLCFGLNGATSKVKRGKEYFKGCYLSLINTVRTASPETKIIISSCFPVAENMDMSNYSVTLDGLNGCIDTLNSWAIELCEENNLKYLNVNEILTDSHGRLKLEFQVGDGHHLTREAYIKILEYIRTHGYK